MGTPEVWRELEAQFRQHAERGRDLHAYVFLEVDYQASYAQLRAYGLSLEQNPDTHPVQMESYRQRARQAEAEDRNPRHPIGNWMLTTDSRNTREGAELLALFESLAERAAVQAGAIPLGASSDAAIHEWLHLIRSNLPHQMPMDHVIENVWSASALMCHILHTRALNSPRPTPREAIQAYLDECGWTVEVLASRVRLTPRSVARHLAGGTISTGNQLAYATTFSKELGRTIHAAEFQCRSAS